MNKQNAVWIASYPKSGNTWVHSVIRVAGNRYGFPQVDMDVYNMQRSGDLPRVCPAVDERVSNTPSVVLKTHSAYRAEGELHAFPDLELVNSAYVHIYRNPLDVLLSYLNFTRIEFRAQQNNDAYKQYLFVKMLGFEQPYEYDHWLEGSLDSIPQCNLDHALDFFSDNNLNIQTLSTMSGNWIDNTQSWIDASKNIPGCSIRYEDCLDDPEQFMKICELFIFKREDVLRALDFVNSKAKSMAKDGSKDQAVFYNKMSAYYFLNYFSMEAIDRFMSKNEATLTRFGYSSLMQHI